MYVNRMPETIGISYDSSKDPFYSGGFQTATVLAEMFQALGRAVFLLDTNVDSTLPQGAPNLDLFFMKLYDARVDTLIDIDGYINPSMRKKVAKKTIVFMRTFLQFSEMDKSVYPEAPYRRRDMSDVSEIWCWDILNPVETIDSIQTLFPCPIRRAPFIWSPTSVNLYTPSAGPTSQAIKDLEVHIAEKNDNNTSSSIIPLVAIKEFMRRGIAATYKCHNMERIIDNRFLKENVLDNIEIDKLPVKFVPQEPFYNWAGQGRHLLFSHSRFIPLRIGLLNALWLGIPVLHNSPVLRDLNPALAELYYPSNSISGAADTLERFLEAADKWVWNKECILTKWGVQERLDEWNRFSSTLSNPAAYPVVRALSNDAKVPPQPIKQIVIAFLDIWPGFNFNSNFIMNALRHEAPGLDIKGIEYYKGCEANLLIFGPYSHAWKLVPNNIPKVYFSAENWTVPIDDDIALFLTSSRIEDDKHIRIPTWTTFIDWFSGATELPTNTTDNPILLPLHFAITPHPVPFNKRDEFCAFVVSNPICNFRNETFKALNDYKRVNSGGELYNNIGGRLELKYPGGGCGDISKHHFFSKHKFTISFENSQARGYLTEKLLHAKMAGCVPLYWGDDEAEQDFVPGSFVNLSKFNLSQNVVDIVKQLEGCEDLCSKIAATPILNEEKKLLALTQISKMAKKLLELCAVKSDNGEEDKMPSKIDKIFVINLDTRQDRLTGLMTAEPYLKNIVTRIPAVNGKTLKMNRFIYNLFKHNHFQWKKSLIGCNLSHLTTWSQIVNTPGEYFLVLEDDVRFTPGWLKAWEKCAQEIPSDADILYLGGVLPPNKPALPTCTEQVNKFWAKIRPNTYFSPEPSPTFHFCAYSYILTKAGAKKIMDYMASSHTKFYADNDHMLSSPSVGLKKYFTTPLLSFCFQEEDPAYLNSQFNELHRQDTFDSDIWNNTECFSEDELAPFRSETNKTLYYLGAGAAPQLYEYAWLRNMIIDFELKELPDDLNTVEKGAWYLVQRPYVSQWNSIFKGLSVRNKYFKVLHLSDEFSEAGRDDIQFYNNPKCTTVIRNYWRRDITNGAHIITIPLGYHHKGGNMRSFAERRLVWSFHGNSWYNRKEDLKSLEVFVPNTCHFVDEWNAPNMTTESKYLADLEKSKFCPIPRGNNAETFRLYEALETGTIPIYVRQNGDELFWEQLRTHLEMVELESWAAAVSFMQRLLDNVDEAEQYRIKLHRGWMKWKGEVKDMCAQLI
jgi:GR25 family glycosyltransferase involved in LPS biosynthesis